MYSPPGRAENNAIDYTASNISYDLNGNIKTMNQKGGNYPGPGQNMDVLTYQYTPNSNQLQSVEDAGVPLNGLPDFRNGISAATEYFYDLNGNMTRDDNKGLTISYNYLNKPAVISVTGKGTIYYTYDAGGNLLRKRLDSAGTITMYDYFGNFVYKGDVLQYITNEEGRARPIANDSTGNQTRFVYDYFVKDHLGNVRSTVTAEPINSAYLAGHEMAMANVEQLIFDHIPSVRSPKPGSTNPADGMAARLEGGDPDTRVGTAIMLQVMPGDKFEISTDSYYEGENQTGEESGAAPLVGSLMTALMGGGTYAGTPISELPENMKIISGLLTDGALPEFLQDIQLNDNPLAPKAHLNYLFFDNKLQLVPSLSGSIQVQGGGTTGWHNSGSVTIGPGAVGNNVIQPAYVIIYVDNQTIGKNVWFDNVHVEHYTSKLLEEDHYYPFGLTVGISQTGQGNLPGQPYKFQEQRHDNEFGINIYSFKYREHDPTIGRFWQIDPLTDKYTDWAPYVFSGNRVVNARELEGLEPYVITGRSFIPAKSVPNPFSGASASKSFAGDNRNIFYVNTSAYRTEQKVRIDFEHNKVTTLSNRANSTHGLDSKGNVVAVSSPEKAGPSPTYTPATMGDKSTTVNMQVDASNQLVVGAPSINYDVNIKVSEEKDGSISYDISGKRDGFPAYEFFITNEADGKSYLMHGSTPAQTGETPNALFPPMDKDIKGSGNSNNLKPIEKK